MLPRAERQYWAPLWADIVVELFARYIRGVNIPSEEIARWTLSRNTILLRLRAEYELSAAFETVWRLGGYPGAADFLRKHFPHVNFQGLTASTEMSPWIRFQKGESNA